MQLWGLAKQVGSLQGRPAGKEDHRLAEPTCHEQFGGFELRAGLSPPLKGLPE